MHKLLHIVATPRGDDSRTLQVSEVFLKEFQTHHPDWMIDELDLAKEDLPSLNPKSVEGKYALLDGKELFGTLKETWIEILQHIERFKSSDLFLISTPMWNFSIPYQLKHYIDLIVQPKHLFRYTKTGAIGLLENKKMVVITSRGGKYTGNDAAFDFQEPYLRTLFNFVGIENIQFIHAEPMDRGLALQQEKIKEAQLVAQRVAKELDV